jgi:hypothetical protein
MLCLLVCSLLNPFIRVSETKAEEIDCFKIETPSATYLYGKRGAGFVSIFDKNGVDWVSYSSQPRALGEYRGLPKCGQPTKFFHCGYSYGQYKTDNIFETRVTVQTADHAQLESITKDGKNACTWDFYPTHATMTLTRINLPTFWFLYEGTPGGKLESDKDFVLRPDGKKTFLNEPWSEVVPWVCFGASETPIGFLCLNHQVSEAEQTDSYVSWPFEKEKDGQYHHMTVFGFGRKGYKELVKHVPDLKQLPARFSIAFVEKAELEVALRTVERLLSLK